MIAEFWNTITNVLFIALSLLGLFNSIRIKSENRFKIFYILVLIVGLGSTIFHLTLSKFG